MIYLKLVCHNYEYEIKELLKQYFHGEEIRCIEELPLQSKSNNLLVITNGMTISDKCTIFFSKIERGQEVLSNQEIMVDTPNVDTDMVKIKWEKTCLKVTLFKAMESGFNRSLPWGILTGIRPSKIVHTLIDKGLSNNEIINRLKYPYLISDRKVDLLLKVAYNEREILYPYDRGKVSIYIGIPFCPTRCIYCSFVSHVLGEDRSILMDYIHALCIEIYEIGNYLKEHRIEVESIYIGGGTPTVLNDVELNFLLSHLHDVFDINKISEYTLEAGRPDTINKNKLQIAFDHGINRISINPQTMNKITLDRIGRKHTPEDIIETFYMAKQMGFNFINMDLILGLPGENKEDVENTLKAVNALHPENITIHTMSIKRGSKLKEQEDILHFQREGEVLSMLDYTQKTLDENGYLPYYLYRQKYMMGNLENVGYYKRDHKSIYNIQMMGEKQTIIGLGAGSTTKVVYIEENRIERVANLKNVSFYIDRLQEMIDRKLEILDTLYR